MMKKETFAVFGGAFSPPHRGHIRAAEAFFRAVEPERLLILPSSVSPHKAPVDGACDSDRLAMCRLAFSHIPRTEVSDMEYRRPGKSYTVLTLRELSQKGRRLVLLVGTDMFLTLDTWHCAEEVFRLADIAVIRREDESETHHAIKAQAEQYKERYGARILTIDASPLTVSSTEVRGILKSGGDTADLLTPEVAEYIKERRLYRE